MFKLKKISVIVVLISTFDLSFVKEIHKLQIDNATEEYLNITDFKNNFSENFNLFRENDLKELIEKYEEEFKGPKFDDFIRQVDLKQVQNLYENEDDNNLFNRIIGYKNYELLCLGKKSLSTKIQSKLKCRYKDRGIPFLKIAPFKEEEAYLDPRIVIFHDIVYQEEIDTMKRLAEPKMKKATFFDDETGEDVFLDSRITDTAWLERENHKHIDNVYLRLQLITGLSLIPAEDLQMAYYPIRGKYEPHFDFESTFPQTIENSLPYYHDRIATVLLYLNNVEEGGATVFTKVDVSLTPKTGSAAFWYNLKPNGFRDYLTSHAACPVISGSKWAANLWIREAWQEFHRPCTLDNQPRDAAWENIYIIKAVNESTAPNKN